jgi:hypothetical protein
MSEDGGKERFPLLQQVLNSSGVDFSLGTKSILEEHLSPDLRNIFKMVISTDLLRLEIHLIPLLHLNLLLQKKRI